MHSVHPSAWGYLPINPRLSWWYPFCHLIHILFTNLFVLLNHIFNFVQMSTPVCNQNFIFLPATSTFTFNHFLFKNFTPVFEFKNSPAICLTSCLHEHKENLPLLIFFLIPLNFHTPANNHATLVLSSLVQHSVLDLFSPTKITVSIQY